MQMSYKFHNFFSSQIESHEVPFIQSKMLTVEKQIYHQGIFRSRKNKYIRQFFSCFVSFFSIQNENKTLEITNEMLLRMLSLNVARSLTSTKKKTFPEIFSYLFKNPCIFQSNRHLLLVKRFIIIINCHYLNLFSKIIPVALCIYIS